MTHSDLINADTVRRFLELLHARAAAALSHCAHPGVIQLVSIAPDDRGMSTSPFNVGDVPSMLAAALADARSERNVYVELRTTRPGRPTERGRGKIESTIGCFGFGIDHDNDTGKGGHANGRDTTVTETSPGNFQELIFLARGLDAGDAKPLGDMIRKAAGADHCTGVITQPFRVPGLPNFPNAKKRARGRVVVPTKLVRVSDKVWTPPEIEAAFSTAGTPANQPYKKPAETAQRLTAPRKITGVKKRLRAKTSDRSAQFQSAVNAAVRAGMPPEQFEALAREHSDGCASKYLENGDRLKQEIERSYAKTETPGAPAVSVARKEPVKTSVLPDRDHVRRGDGHVAPDGSELLDRVFEFLGCFVAYPDRHAQVAHALWAAHCHLIDHFETTPRLAFISPEPASGKTRALEITELLVPNPVLAVNVSPAYLIRKVAAEEGVTILFDEIDTVFGPRAKENNEDVRALLNAGYRRGAVVGRCVMQGSIAVTEELPAFAPVALAGLGTLPDTVSSRSIIIRMQRRAPHEHVTPYRRREHAEEGERLCSQLASWAAAVADRITVPDMPGEIADRDADCWEALFAVADAAGGQWPDTARVAGVAGVAAFREEREERHGIRLLSDLRKVIGKDKYKLTAVILKALAEVDESPWADVRGKPLTDVGLAKRLRPYSIKPKPIRVGDNTLRGYWREDFEDAWRRYLSPVPETRNA